MAQATIGKITGAATPEIFNSMHRLELSCRTEVAAMSGNNFSRTEVLRNV